MGEDGYISIDDGPEVELKVKGSRFLARAVRVDDDEAARERRATIARRYHDGSHVCSASRIGTPADVIERVDDDGEPLGTAGQPILGAILRVDVFDAAVFVTRWFGGTKLGKGGLVRAYGEAAAMALEGAPRRTLWREVVFDVRCPYELIGSVEASIARAGDAVRACERDFGETPRFLMRVLQSRADALRREIVEATAGRANVAEA